MTTKQARWGMVGVLAALLAAALACVDGGTGSSGGGALAYGDMAQGAIDYSGERDDWTFEGHEGDVINIAMVGRSTMNDTYLELYGPNGAYLTYDDDSGMSLNSLISGYTLPETGAYRIVARAYSTGTGPYEISLTLTELREIAYGETVSGQITFAEPQQSWAFDGEAGDIVTVSMIGQMTLTDTYLGLYGPSDTLLASDDDSGGALNRSLIEGYTLPETGTYRILACPLGEYTGPYELTLTQTVLHDIAYGQTLPDELTAESPVAYWRFQGEAWDVVTLSASGQGIESDTRLELLDPDGNPLTQSLLVEGLPTIPDFVLQESGPYRVVVEAGSGSGSYDLALRRTTLQARDIALGQTLSGNLTEASPTALWTFEGTADEAVEASVAGQGQQGGLRLTLYNPDGGVMAQDRSTNQPPSAMLRGYALPVDGTYRILVEAASGYTGGYVIALSQTEILAGAIAYGQTLPGELTDAEPQQSWHFEGQAGDVVTISMVSLGGSLTDTYLELYGPNGEYLISDDDSGGNLSALIRNYELPYTGPYEIVARAFSTGTGPYELALGRVEYHALTVTYIAYGEMLSGELAPSYLQGYWFFEGDAGDVATVTVTGQGDFRDPHVDLIGPDDTIVIGTDGEGACLIEDYELPISGAYTLVVRSLQGGLGAYELALAGE
jgi:hypothetical protein